MLTHRRTSVKQALALLSALYLALIFLAASCAPAAAPVPVPAAEATAAPAAAPTSAPEATTAPSAASAGGAIRFGAWLSGDEKAVIGEQIASFVEETGINVDVQQYEDFGQFVDALDMQGPTGNLPDVVGVWRNMLEQLSSKGYLLELGELSTAFLASARKAAQVDGVVYAFPWAGYQCIPDYRLLAISRTSNDQPAARKLADFLTGREPQIMNFKAPQTWYPTLQSVNDEYAGCKDSGAAVKSPTGEQIAQIQGQIGGDVMVLQDSLKSSNLWPADQPTSFNVDWSTGIGIVDESGKYSTIQVAAVPVRSDDAAFFQEDRLKEYISKGNKRITVGALQVIDESVLGGKIPKGTYAVVWEWVDGTVANDRFIVVDQDGKEVYQGWFADLDGSLVTKQGASSTAVLQPYVVAEEGSWFLDWLFDNRSGRVP